VGVGVAAARVANKAVREKVRDFIVDLSG